jgi:hypothetical protein
MDIPTTVIIETGVAALLFAVTFLWGDILALWRRHFKNPHAVISFGAGMSSAYVFMHLMPELHEARSAFVESVSMELRYEGMAIYYFSLLGFLLFYGLDHLRVRLGENTEVGEVGLAFKVQIGGFAAYVWLMSYLLLHSLGSAPLSSYTAMYAVAMTFHFLALENTLRAEHGAAYHQIGKFVLAGAALIGWGTGMLFTVPQHILALLVAFISGAIIMNSTVMELGRGEESRFLPLVAGGIIYGLILLPLG